MLMNNRGKGKMLIIIIAAVVLLLAGLGIIAFKGKGKGKKHVKLPTSQMQLGEFVVNLADTGDVRYLKTNVVLEVEGHKAEGGGGHGGGGSATDPRIRDAVIEVLSSKRFSELAAPKGKDKLKADIIEAVNHRMHDEAKVVGVYFNEFAMQ